MEGRSPTTTHRAEATNHPDIYELASTSHNQLGHLFEMNRTYDIRSALREISVPTLVIHLEENQSIPRRPR